MKKKLYLKFSDPFCDHCKVTIEKLLDTLHGKDISIQLKDNLGEITLYKEIPPETIMQIVQITPHKVIQSQIEEIQEESLRSSISISKKNISSNEFDLIILGGGSSAFSSAIKASEWNKKILIVNDGLPWGGTCVNVGCIPSKLWMRIAEAFYYAKYPKYSFIDCKGIKLDFKSLIEYTKKIQLEFRKQKYLEVLKYRQNITILKGFGKFIDPHTIEVQGQQFTAKSILIATGSSPYIPPIPGIDKISYLTNESIYDIQELPEHLIIIGGRYIALENAQLFARLGSKVTLIQRSSRILPQEMPDISETIKTYLEEEEITVVTNSQIIGVEKRHNKILVHAYVNNTKEIFEGSHLLLATGRKGNIDKLNLEVIGIETYNQNFIKTNEYLQTSVPHIYAAGDVTGKFLYVYAAAYEGALAVENMFHGNKKKKDYSFFPWVIFTDPQVAGIGMDEQEANLHHIDYEVSIIPLKDIPHSYVENKTKGFIKLIRRRDNHELIGARIIAHNGAELLMQLSIALKHKITTEELKYSFYPYLTLSEGIKLCTIAFDQDLNKLSCCAI